MTWTQEQEDYLKEHYANISNPKLAKIMGRTKGSILHKAQKMGLSKGSGYMLSECSGVFQKGQTPWNKGLSYKAGGDSKKTRFKKGNIPSTYRPVGSVRKLKRDNIWEIKVSDPNEWMYLHHLIYEAKTGKSINTNRHLLIFKDGNKDNCSFENLELITRKELLLKNRNPKKSGITNRNNRKSIIDWVLGGSVLVENNGYETWS